MLVDVEGEARPEPRPRATVTDNGKVRVYVPGTADAWKHRVRAEVAEAVRSDAALEEFTPIGGEAFAVDLSFRFARPKSHFRTGRFAGELKPGRDALRHTQTPDVDNLAKAVLDAIGAWRKLPRLVWLDDAQVVELRCSKRWANVGEPAGCTIGLWLPDPARIAASRGRFDDLTIFE